jgi:hypothetical protein
MASFFVGERSANRLNVALSAQESALFHDERDGFAVSANLTLLAALTLFSSGRERRQIGPR